MSDQRTRFDYVRTGVQSFISISLGIWFIIAYSLYGREECARPIPIFLLVSGIAQLVLTLITLYSTCCLPAGTMAKAMPGQGGGGTNTRTCLLACCILILGLFMVAWFIVGQVWTFGISEAACNSVIYNTSFWYLICVYIILGLGILLAIVMTCCVAKTLGR